MDDQPSSRELQRQIEALEKLVGRQLLDVATDCRDRASNLLDRRIYSAEREADSARMAMIVEELDRQRDRVTAAWRLGFSAIVGPAVVAIIVWIITGAP